MTSLREDNDWHAESSALHEVELTLLFRIAMALFTLGRLLTTLFSLSVFGASQRPLLQDLINEYVECFNIIHIYGNTTTLDLPIQVLSIITTNTYLHVPWFESFRISLPCVVYFILFPERLAGGYYGDVREKIWGAAYASGSYGINPQIFTHIFTAHFDPNTVKRQAQGWDTEYVYDYRRNVFHLMLDKDGNSVIASSLIYAEQIYGNHDFINVKVGSNATLRQSIDETFQEVYKGDKYFYFVLEKGAVQNVSFATLVTKCLSVPFTFNAMNLSIEDITLLLSAYQLDIWIAAAPTQTAHDVVKSMLGKLSFGMEHMPTFSHGRVEDLAVVTGMKYLNFMTCDGVTQPTSFGFYIKPYDLESWYTYATLAFVFIPLVVLASQIPKIQGIRVGFNFFSDLFWFNVSASLEAGIGIPREADLSLCVNLLLGTWLILTVVLVNAYKGIVVTDLTLPPNTFRKWTSVSQTKGFVYFAPYEVSETLLYQKREMKGLKNVDTMHFEGPVHRCQPRKTLSLDRAGNKSFENIKAALATAGILLSEPSNYPGYCRGAESLNSNNSGGTDLSVRDRYCYQYSMLIKNRNPFVDAFVVVPPINPYKGGVPCEAPSYEAYFKDVLKAIKACRRSGFVEKESVLDALISIAEEDEDTRFFKKGEDKIFKEWEGFHFYGRERGSQVLHTALQNLLAAGIYNLWEKWTSIHNPTAEEKSVRNLTKPKPKAVIKPLDMKTNVSTCFYILFICIGIALITLLAELVLTGLASLLGN